ncbi:putative Ig domain-containing protein [Nocardioides terrisoli]|uniref:putative Ig domain-containing protein n=1 Tax=Nocardioides terrisoli TaxID=3388267 RepID=UPI00287B7B86|nr:putative Ig domain-containing protein [Nocardioides marmorisolisilvae]
MSDQGRSSETVGRWASPRRVAVAVLMLLAALLVPLGVAGGASAVGRSAGSALAAPSGTPAARTVLTAGGFHTCALHPDGTARCWGDNIDGQTDVPAGTFTALTAGGYHTCGLHPDGTAQCWGYNYYRQATAPGGTFTALTAGRSHTCGLHPDGTAQCWGFDGSGQTDVPAGETFTALTVGSDHTCGLHPDGTAQCWGYNTYGQATAPAGTRFTVLTAGYYDTCGLHPDGTAQCWGDNSSGQATVPAGTFTALTAGYTHTCGLHPDGTAQCWGSNTSGQATAPGGTFTALTAGEHHTCGLHPDGTVQCWGANTYGQLGAAPAKPSPAPPEAVVGSAYSHTFTSSTGKPTGRFTVSAGSLPAGLSLTPAGVLSGTPTTAGNSTFTVTAANLIGSTSAEFTLNAKNPTTPTPPTAARSVTLHRDHRTVSYGNPATVFGAVSSTDPSCAAGATVHIDRRIYGQTHITRNVQSTTTNTKGTYTVRFTARRSAHYTARLGHTTVCRQATSTSVAVQVRALVRIRGHHHVNARDRVRMSLQAIPCGTDHQHGTLILQRHTRHGWAKVAAKASNNRCVAIFHQRLILQPHLGNSAAPGVVASSGAGLVAASPA